MNILKSTEHQLVPWNRIAPAVLPSILLVLQFGGISEKELLIVSPVVLLSGIYVLMNSYKEGVFFVDLFLPYLGVLALEIWVFGGLFTNPHSSLLLTRVFLISLCVPSVIVLCRLGSHLKKTIWLILIIFVTCIFLVYNNATHDWSIFAWNVMQWLIYLIPLFAFSLYCSIKFEIPLLLTVAVFEPFWINYNLDPLGSVDHALLFNSGYRLSLAFSVFQVIPVVGFLIVFPIFIFRSSARIDANWRQLILSLLMILPIVFTRYIELKETGAQYLASVWMIILIHTLMLWLPFWLPYSFRDGMKHL
jgi:hypothetical protein